MHVEASVVAYRNISSADGGESSEAIRLLVIAARERQRERSTRLSCNARIPAPLFRRFRWLDPAGRRLMDEAVTKLGLSARAHDRFLKVARTLADLAGSERIPKEHLGEAIQYRGLGRKR